MRRPKAMVKKGEFTDEAWARIAPLLPELRKPLQVPNGAGIG
jgi:hypothetical protein